MKLTAWGGENFKGLIKGDFHPEGPGLYVIDGKNEAGKTSAIDILSALFGGAGEIPTDPIRHGSKAAELYGILDDGALKVERRIVAGKSSLTLSDESGKVKAPQEILDAIVGKRFLDPLAFITADAKTQRETLLRMVDLGLDLDGWAAAYKRVFDTRRDAGRDLKRARAALEATPAVEVADRIDIEEQKSILADQKAILATGREVASEIEIANRRAVACEENIKAANEKIEQLKAEAADWKRQAAGAAASARDLTDALKKQGNPEEITEAIEKRETEIRAAIEHNAKVMADEKAAERRVQAAKEVDEIELAHDSCTLKLDEMKDARANALEAAEFPLEGLSVNDEGVTFGDVPFSQASGARQLQVSLAIAAALSPTLKAVWCRNLSLCDEDSIEAIDAWAKAAGYTVVAEFAGKGPDGSVTIVAGEVAE